MKEFLFGNVQIGFTSQKLVSKASCMELRTPQSYLFYQTKIQIWRSGRERERDFGRVKDSNWENIESNLREFLFDNF